MPPDIMLCCAKKSNDGTTCCTQGKKTGQTMPYLLYREEETAIFKSSTGSATIYALQNGSSFSNLFTLLKYLNTPPLCTTFVFVGQCSLTKQNTIDAILIQ